MEEIDWSKAPEGTTHYNRNNCLYHRVSEDKLNHCSEVSDGECSWVSSEYTNKEVIKNKNLNFVTKPKNYKTTDNTWKIRHIKSDDYRCGRDVALTILYKDVGKGYYEYKYAICSPKDMFCRKKGVAEAWGKEEVGRVYVEDKRDFNRVIVLHIFLSRPVSKEFKKLYMEMF
jgi:hypothetical protein